MRTKVGSGHGAGSTVVSPVPGRVAYEVAWLVTEAALRRRESRGGHHRTDHPRPDPSQARRLPVDPVPAAVA